MSNSEHSTADSSHGESPSFVRAIPYGLLVLGVLLIICAFTLFPPPHERVGAGKLDSGDEHGTESVETEAPAPFGQKALLFVGLAFVIGCVMAYSIERVMKSRQQHEQIRLEDGTRTTTFDALFKTATPDGFLDEMRETLLTPAFVREDLTVTYTFEDKPGATTITVSRKVHFWARNITSRRAVHVMSPSEFVLLDDPTQTVFVECVMESDDKLYGDKMNVTREDIIQKMQSQPISVNPNARVEVTLVVKKTCWRRDRDTWISKDAADGITLNVNAGTLTGKLTFAVDRWHRKPLRKVNSQKWVLESSLLPYQGIILYWKPGEA